MVALPVIYNQRDSRWASVKLGTSNETIGGYGCAVSAVAIMLRYLGIDENPITVNDWLKRNNGFYNKNLIIWQAVNVLSNGKMRFEGITYNAPKYPCIAEVDLIPNNSRHDQHFVVAVSDTQCADPWTGVIRNLSDFGGVKSYRVYSYETPASQGGNMDELEKAKQARDRNWKYGVDVMRRMSVRIGVPFFTKETEDEMKAFAEHFEREFHNHINRIGERERDIETLRNEVTSLNTTVGGKDSEIATLKERIKELESTPTQPVQTLEQAGALFGKLLSEELNRSKPQ